MKDRTVDPSADVEYICNNGTINRTLKFTNITGNGGTEPVYIWAKVDPGVTAPPPADRHPSDVPNTTKKAIVGGAATLRNGAWPASGIYTIHYWFDFGHALFSKPPAACPTFEGSAESSSSDACSASPIPDEPSSS